MIRVRFTTSEFNRETREWVQRISLEFAVIDPETRERVTRADGAERWARLLPFAFRNGDIDVEVSEIAEAEPAGVAFRYSTAA